MNELALFAGAGGGLLATKWLLGWRAVCYVENDLYRVKVLKARIKDGLLDDAPIWDDVRTFDGRPWRGCVDIITAGFPCQPFSSAGKQLADQDERNLWPDTIRIIREVQPRWCLLENVPNLLSGSHGYYGQILQDLAESGYDAVWRMLSAAEMGAPHKRDRLWVVAYPSIKGGGAIQQPRQWDGFIPSCQAMANADSEGKLQSRWADNEKRVRLGNSRAEVSHSHGQRQIQQGANGSEPQQPSVESCCHGRQWWQVESRLGRMADGVANRVDRIAALGDGQVPAVVRTAWELLSLRRDL